MQASLLPLARLPARIRAKIRLEEQGALAAVEKPDETSACWIWTGNTQPGKHTTRNRWIPPDRETANASPVQFVYKRATPMASSTEHGYQIPAYRLVFALASRISARAVPALRRCPCDACVSPYHVQFLNRAPRAAEMASKAPAPAPRLRLVGTNVDALAALLTAYLPPEGMTALLALLAGPGPHSVAAPAAGAKPGLADGALSRADILKRLRDADVSEFLERDSAAEEAGIPLNELTEDIWNEYANSLTDAE